MSDLIFVKNTECEGRCTAVHDVFAIHSDSVIPWEATLLFSTARAVVSIVGSEMFVSLRSFLQLAIVKKSAKVAIGACIFFHGYCCCALLSNTVPNEEFLDQIGDV